MCSSPIGISQPTVFKNTSPLIEFEWGRHSSAVLEAERIIISPGISDTVPIVTKAKMRGIPVSSEIEFAAQWWRGPIIGITGTNGKSTTVTLTSEILSAHGLPVREAGNIGTAFSEVVQNNEDTSTIAVLELSSFQLEHSSHLLLDAAAILNLAPDHLDRYPDVMSYYDAKLNIISSLKENAPLIINADDQVLLQRIGNRVSTYSSFSLKANNAAARIRDAEICVGDQRFSIADLRLPGIHNRQNVAAAILLAATRGPLQVSTVAEVLAGFSGLPHRLAHVHTQEGVRFFNDSKATTIESTMMALSGFDKPLILIAGGRNKGGDFTRLRPLISEHVAHAVVIGEAADELSAAWQDVVTMDKCTSMETAVKIAKRKAKEHDGDVLLSPACASFDMFRDFEHRGQQFTRLVKGEDDE
jgi:UDP-N-acetylmuramoylalanine--D-glutamate ligase